MLHYLSIEFLKIKKYRTFWVLAGLFVFLTVLIIFGVEQFINNVTLKTNEQNQMALPETSLYQFPDIWHNISFLAGYFKIILGIIFLILLTNEYQFKTIRHSIINGMSRQEYFLSKFSLMVVFSLLLTLILLISGLILGFAHSEELTLQTITSKLSFPFAFAAEVLFYLSFVFMLGTLIQRAGLSILLLLIYSYIIEPIFGFRLPDAVADWLPLRSFGNIIRVPETALMNLFGMKFEETVNVSALGISLLWAGIFSAITFYLIRKRDL